MKLKQTTLHESYGQNNMNFGMYIGRDEVMSLYCCTANTPQVKDKLTEGKPWELLVRFDVVWDPSVLRIRNDSCFYDEFDRVSSQAELWQDKENMT